MGDHNSVLRGTKNVVRISPFLLPSIHLCGKIVLTK
jgi:hypothetical protein